MPYNTVSSSKTTCQSQFGTQKAVLLPMATWCMGPLAEAQFDGDAERFASGIVPLPQCEEADTAHSKSFGDPTGFTVSSRLSGERLGVAKDFVAWAGGRRGALAMYVMTVAYVLLALSICVLVGMEPLALLCVCTGDTDAYPLFLACAALCAPAFAVAFPMLALRSPWLAVPLGTGLVTYVVWADAHWQTRPLYALCAAEEPAHSGM